MFDRQMLVFIVKDKLRSSSITITPYALKEGFIHGRNHLFR